MRDKLGPGTTLSYCTNVHAIGSPDDLVEALRTHTPRIKESLGLNEALGVGLFLPKRRKPNPVSAVYIALYDTVLRDEPSSRKIRRCLKELGLEAPTANAFPFSDFHQEAVKHRVYEPTWGERARLDHTLEAAHLLDLSEHEGSRSISTLPIGWSRAEDADRELCRAAAQILRQSVEEFESLMEVSLPFTVDLEPEPGCVLDTCDDVIAFFNEHLPDPEHRRVIGVCHDVCHAAVMFEDQRDVLRRYAEAGIRVNKVQISSALDIDVGVLGVDAAIDRLRAFAEPRYLHQTGFMTENRFELIEDLPDAIERLESGDHPGDRPDRLRVHFHVPLYLDTIGDLGTTNDQIKDAVLAAREYHDTKHFEVETYAWAVLPEEHQRDTLAEGIADELRWVLDTVAPEARAVVPRTATP